MRCIDFVIYTHTCTYIYAYIYPSDDSHIILFCLPHARTFGGGGSRGVQKTNAGRLRGAAGTAA
jgi:hypothetical protein